MLKILNETERQFGKYYYVRLDLQLKKSLELKKEDLPAKLLGKRVVQLKDLDGVKLICEDESWLMFRSSGTEALMRIYAEGKSLNQANNLLALGRSLILNKPR